MRLYFVTYVQGGSDVVAWYPTKGRATDERVWLLKNGFFPTPVQAFDVPNDKQKMCNFLTNVTEHIVENFT